MKYAIAAAAVVGLASAMPAADGEWNTWTTTTTTSCEETTTTPSWNTWTTTTPAAEWNTWTTTTTSEKCSTTSSWTTTVCGDDKSKWDNCHVETSYTTLYADECTWAPWPTSSPPKETWAPAPVYESSKCSSVSTYTTTECGAESSKWDNCKVATKTTTVYPETCTWGEWTTVEVKTPEATTWATYSASTWGSAPAPAPAKSTPAAASWSTVSAPVAKWTGAADKQAVGMGALAIAAVAALL